MNPPPYPSFPRPQNETIELREILPEDIKDLIEISFYDGKAASTTAEAQDMQDRIDADYLNGSSVHWGIVDLEKNVVVGTCGYYRGFENNTGELGCVLKPTFRGQGYMRSALELAIQFGFQHMRLAKIIAITTPQNVKALQLLKRLNFVETANSGDGEILFQYLAPHRPG